MVAMSVQPRTSISPRIFCICGSSGSRDTDQGVPGVLVPFETRNTDCRSAHRPCRRLANRRAMEALRSEVLGPIGCGVSPLIDWVIAVGVRIVSTSNGDVMCQL